MQCFHAYMQQDHKAKDIKKEKKKKKKKAIRSQIAFTLILQYIVAPILTSFPLVLTTGLCLTNDLGVEPSTIHCKYLHISQPRHC